MVDLEFDAIDGVNPSRSIAFLHGILGRANNLRTIARRFVDLRPDWTALLVDLRGHGRSPRGSSDPSIESAARDVVDLALKAPLPVHTIVGHSFGGKIALEVAAMDLIDSLEHVIVIDSSPGSQEPSRNADSPLLVVEMLESLPRSFESRSTFVEAVVAKGETRELAQWLSQSVEKENDHFRFALDLDEIRALILDYYSRDLWPVIEDPPGVTHVHLVIADRSSAYSKKERERAQRIASSNTRVTVDVLDAGHWVHADDPDGLLKTVLDRISPEVKS
jgi:pimeloyl-ACP methyl ester carboxylesterase